MRKLCLAVVVIVAILMVAVSYEARAQTPQQVAFQQELARLQSAIDAFNSRCVGARSRTDAALYQQCAAEKARLSAWQTDLNRRVNDANAGR